MSKVSLLLASLLCSTVSLPVAAQTTLAEAAAAAAKIKHEWPASANAVPVFDPLKAVSTTPAVGVTSDVPAVEAVPVVPVTRDKLYWKTRMRTVTTTLRDDQAFLAAAVTSEKALNVTVHRGIEDFLAIRDRRQLAVVENQWQDSVKEVGRLQALVQNDTRAKAEFELEAHRAGVPKGWLVLE